ncbi:MAG: hypothetical protein ABIG84_01370 [archaeon]
MNISISYLQSSGIYEFLLPFLLITAITYAIFNYVKAKAEKKKEDFVLNDKAIGIVSVIIGLFATNHKPLRDMLFKWMPFFIILLIILFLILLFLKLFESESKDYLPLMILLIIILVTLGAYGTDNISRALGMDSENIMWSVGVILFLLILWAAYQQHNKESGTSEQGGDDEEKKKKAKRQERKHQLRI